MAMLFQRRLAIPLWAIACFTLALTAPPSGTLFLMPATTVFAIAAVGKRTSDQLTQAIVQPVECLYSGGRIQER